jgi:hypothetical protein
MWAEAKRKDFRMAEEVAIVQADDDRGTFLDTRDDIPADTLIFSIPAYAVLTPHASVKGLPLWAADIAPKLSGTVVVALRMLLNPHESVTLKTSDANVVTLPDCNWAHQSAATCLMTSPLGLGMSSASFVAALGNTNVADMLTCAEEDCPCARLVQLHLKRSAELRADFDTVAAACAKAKIGGLPFSYAKFARFVIFTQSRSVNFMAGCIPEALRFTAPKSAKKPKGDKSNKTPWFRDSTVPALCPMVELLNHVPDSLQLGITDDGVVQLVTKGPIGKGQEVSIDYGAHSDTDFFLEYGFVPRANDSAVATLRLPDMRKKFGAEKVDVVRKLLRLPEWIEFTQSVAIEYGAQMNRIHRDQSPLAALSPRDWISFAVWGVLAADAETTQEVLRYFAADEILGSSLASSHRNDSLLSNSDFYHQPDETALCLAWFEANMTVDEPAAALLRAVANNALNSAVARQCECTQRHCRVLLNDVNKVPDLEQRYFRSSLAALFERHEELLTTLRPKRESTAKHAA